MIFRRNVPHFLREPFPERRRHAFRIGNYHDAAQIEPVRIVAGVDGKVPARMFRRMVRTRMEKLSEPIRIEVKNFPDKALCEFRAELSMFLVVTIRNPTGIVEQREKADHGRIGEGFPRKQKSIGFHLVPVQKPVHGIFIQKTVLVNEIFQRGEIYRFHITSHNAP